MPKIIRSRVEADHAHGEPVCCWACGQRWPNKVDLILDADNNQVRIDGADPIQLKKKQADVLETLINRFGRWVDFVDIADVASNEDATMTPQRAATWAAAPVKELTAILEGTRYCVQKEARRVRLINLERLQTERIERQALSPDRRRDSIAYLSTMQVLDVGRQTSQITGMWGSGSAQLNRLSRIVNERGQTVKKKQDEKFGITEKSERGKNV